MTIEALQDSLQSRGAIAFRIEQREGVAILEFSGPEPNFFSMDMLTGIADALEELDQIPTVRAILLTAKGRHFCGGANFSGGNASVRGADVYAEGLRILATRKPIVAALQGAVIGGGLGLALAADFRVVDETTRLSANFVKLGMHPGFGLTLTLPRLIGCQRAADLFLTGRRVKGEEAVRIGLADRMATDAQTLKADALQLAVEIAANAPLAVQATRSTLRIGLVDEIAERLRHEAAEQVRLAATADFREGVKAVAERRPGNWVCA